MTSCGRRCAEDFATEKQVILEEIAKYDDQPPFGAYEKSMAVHFGEHPMARSVLGTVESVSKLTPQQMRAYFERRYSPNNMSLVAAGNVDFERLRKQAEACCGAWTPHAADRPTPRAGFQPRCEVYQNEIASQQYVVQIANGPASEDDTRYAARVLSSVVGDDGGSRMFWELVDTGRAEYAAMYPYDFQGTGIFMSVLCGTPEDTEENLRRMRRILEDIEANGVTPEELLQAQNKICSQVVLQSERPTNRLIAMGNNWLQRRKYQTVREIISAYQKLSCEDIRDVIRQYPLTQQTTVAVGPLREMNLPG